MHMLAKVQGGQELTPCIVQGLLKNMGKEKYGEQFRMWQKQAAEFEIDGRPPVRSASANTLLPFLSASLTLQLVEFEIQVPGQLFSPALLSFTQHHWNCEL